MGNFASIWFSNVNMKMDIAKLPAWIIELSNSRVIRNICNDYMEWDFDGKRNFAKVYVPDKYLISVIFTMSCKYIGLGMSKSLKYSIIDLEYISFLTINC